MWFAILGPMRVTDGAVTLPVAGVRQRILLGALLAHANQPVPAEQLAEIVWDGYPPKRAVPTLRTYVMRLRHNLGTAGASRILTRDLGYAIEVGQDEVDALAFEMLCRDTGAAIRNQAWPRASDTATRALALWRGTPLVDVPCQALRDAWIPRLDQHRIQVLEWRIEAELHLGHHEHLIPQLHDLTAQYPLSEHFHAQLMIAFARAGRQAEALAAYQHARNLLVDELGIEPGPDLRHLHGRVLAGDADLLTAPRSDEARQLAPTALVPRQLPAGARHFTGRLAELDTLLGLPDAPGNSPGTGGTVVISAISGMAGIGKTALAVYAAHRLADSFPDGQLFIDLHGYTQGYEPRTPSNALEAFLRALGVPSQRIPQDVEERAALYRQHLAGTRTLILLDNAASEAQVRLLLPASAGCLVLVTSRRRFKGLDDAHPLPLDVLPEADAVALLHSVAGPERAAADDPLLAEIAEQCGRLPLALRIAAALLRHRPAWTLQHLADLLLDQSQRVIALADGERDLGAVFDLSYANLSDAQQRLFRYLGLIPGPDFDAYATAALTGTDPSTATHLLEDLIDHNLLLQHVPGRYRLHDLIRAHARALANQEPVHDREAALERLLDYYQHTANRADTLITPYPRPEPEGPVPRYQPPLPDQGAAWAWLRAERPNLLAGLQHAATHDSHKRTVVLANGLAALLLTDGPWADAIILHTAAATAAHHLGDRRGQACALFYLGDVQMLTGDYQGAAHHLHEALNLYRDIGERLGQANSLIRLGKTRGMTGDYQGAAHDLHEALQLCRDLSDQRGQAYALSELGDIRMLTGDYQGAAHHLHEALHLYRAIGDDNGQGNTLATLGQLGRLTGDYQGAAHHLEAALDLYRRIGARGNEAWALNHYAAVITAAGDPARALSIYHDALRLAQDVRHPDDEAHALEGIAECYLHTGATEDGAARLKQALDIFQRLAMTPDANRVQARLSRLLAPSA